MPIVQIGPCFGTQILEFLAPCKTIAKPTSDIIRSLAAELLLLVKSAATDVVTSSGERKGLVPQLGGGGLVTSPDDQVPRFPKRFTVDGWARQ